MVLARSGALKDIEDAGKAVANLNMQSEDGEWR